MKTVKTLPFYVFFRAASKCTYICREDIAVEMKKASITKTTWNKNERLLCFVVLYTTIA